MDPASGVPGRSLGVRCLQPAKSAAVVHRFTSDGEPCTVSLSDSVGPKRRRARKATEAGVWGAWRCMPDLVTRYRAKSAAKRLAAAPMRLMPGAVLNSNPSVTVVIPVLERSSRLTVAEATLRRYTRYTNYGVEVAVGEKPSEVYDRYLRTSETDYWVGVHDDMVFLAGDWLADVLKVMEDDRDLGLVACQRLASRKGVREPHGKIIDLEESLATWLFCVRSSIRERIATSFAFHKEPPSSPSGPRRCYDVGGRLLRDMRGQGMKWTAMPWWFRLKYQHVGSLSWALGFDAPPAYRALKEHQLAEAARRAERIGGSPRSGRRW